MERAHFQEIFGYEIDVFPIEEKFWSWNRCGRDKKIEESDEIGVLGIGRFLGADL
jgi:hypothetical protein